MKGQDMLPVMSNAKRNLIAGVTAIAVLVAGTSPALAWGKKEQQFLAGVVTTIIAGQVIRDAREHGAFQPRQQPVYQQPVYQQPVYTPPPPRQPVYYQPAPVSIYHTPAAYAFNSYTSNERRRIQSTLTGYGYYHGGIDGSFGPGTYGAIEAYAARTGRGAMLDTQGGTYGLLDSLLF
jgi:murein DD-endopeptidase MepM/ murein hydrolase activator NlpD